MQQLEFPFAPSAEPLKPTAPAAPDPNPAAEPDEAPDRHDDECDSVESPPPDDQADTTEDNATSTTTLSAGMPAKAEVGHPILELDPKPSTLDAAIGALRAAGILDPKALQRLACDVRVATRLVQRSVPSAGTRPASLPAAPVDLRPLIAKVLPARHRMTSKRWSSIRSSIAMVLKLTGWHAPTGELRAGLTPEWQAAADLITSHPQRALVAALGRFCARQGVAPAAVAEATLDAFKAWRTEHTLDLSPGHNVSSLRSLWNRALRTIPDWPGRKLEPPPNARRYVLPADQFDPRFLADLDAYMAKLERPNPLDPVFNRRKAPLTLTDIRGSLMRAASVLEAKGVPVAGIVDIVAPAPFKTVLLEAFERMGDGMKWPSRAISIAGYLHAAARDWAKLPPDALDEVVQLRKLVKCPAGELKQKARDRLAQFDDPKLLSAFFGLPYEMFSAADRMAKAGKPKRAAYLHQTALAMAILIVKPLRRRNLAALEHGRHFHGKGNRPYSELSIAAQDTKNGVHLQAAMPDQLARRIETHIRDYRPFIELVPCPFLFPGPTGKPVAASTLALRIVKLIERQVGAEFNVHSARHLAATLLLEEDEGNLAVAQTLLGHTDARTTAKFYAQQRTRGAQIKWMQTLERRVAATRRYSQRRSAGSSAPSPNRSTGGQGK